jgi:uncharacterized protein (DUF1778 family)
MRQSATTPAKAEQAIDDPRLFILEPKAYEEFLALLDAPVPPSEDLRRRLMRRPAWDR